MGPEEQQRQADWSDLDPELVARLEASPLDEAAWTALAEQAARQDRPEGLAALGRSLLHRVDGEGARSLAERVLRFHEEWFGDEAPAWLELVPLVLRIDPALVEDTVARLTMGLTDAERWDELFALYDAAAGALQEAPERRARLLEEAAQAAKDFARRLDKAADYYARLAELRPDDERLGETLERLLRRLGRWEQLAERWRSQLPEPAHDEGLAARLRLAETLLEQLGRAEEAMHLLLAEDVPWGEHERAVTFLERLAGDERLAASARARAWLALAEWRRGRGRDAEAAEAFERAAEAAEGEGRLQALRRWAAWLGEAGRGEEALSLWARLVREAAALGRLDEEALAEGARLAEATGRGLTWAEGLAAAASGAPERVGAALLLAAVDTAEQEDPERALGWLQALPAADEAEGRRVRRRRVGLLERLGRDAELVDALVELARETDEPAERRELVARAAERAERCGELDRAAALLREECERVPQDAERFARWVAVLERGERWAELAEALRWRLQVPGLPEAERHRVRERLADLLAGPAGDLEGALALAEEAMSEEPTPQRVDRVAELLARLQRSDRLEAVWRWDADRLAERLVGLRLRLAELRGEQGDGEGAARELGAVLDLAPGHEAARAALRELLRDPSAEGAAAEALARDARRRGDRAGWLEVAETLARKADRSERREALLREALPGWERAGEQERVAWARGELERLAEAEERWGEALRLVQARLQQAEGPEERMELALRCVDLFARMEQAGTPERWLGEVLERDPGRREALEQLAARLAGQGRWGELCERFEGLARRLEQAGDAESAAALWARVAEVAEERLRDPERTAQALRRLAALAPSADVFERLAALAEARGEPAQSAHWLERWWREFPGSAGPALALRLAEALRSASQPERALEVLRTAFAEHPDEAALREALLEAVEAVDDPQARAQVLLTVAERSEGEPQVALALRAAEDLERAGAGEPLRAALRLAAAGRPEDADLQLRYAEAALEAGDLEEAERVAGALLERFGRRRTPQRAQAHRVMARVAEARGELDAAQEQLEAASEVDRSDPHTLRALAKLARKRGDLDRAERVYRGLLLAVRRAKGELPWTSSELMWELSELASQRGDEEQAAERLESAFAEAERDDREAEHLARAALASERPEEALRALDARLAAQAEAASAGLRRLRARVLAEGLGRGEEAFEEALGAVRAEPGAPEGIELARRLAREVGGSARLLEALREAAEARGEPSLWLRVADVADEDLGDVEQALEAVRRAQAAGADDAASWLRLARLAAARGERDLQREALERVAADEAAAPSRRAEALRGLAELAIEQERPEEVVERVRAAMDLEPAPGPYLAVLERAAAGGGGGEALDALYGEVARALGEPAAWLRYLTWRAERNEAGVREVREALEEAERQQDAERAERLLERLVEVAAAETDVETARQAMLGLAARREEAGDLAGAIGWLERAIEASADEEEAAALRLRLAEVASREGGDPQRALRTYEELLAREPGEERLWGPMLALLARLGDEDALRERVEQVVEAVLEPDARNRARMELARFYLAQGPDRMAEAVAVLRHVVDEDPEHEEAVERLVELYERAGYDDELAELLWRRLDAALDQDDRERALEVGLRLGALLATSRPVDAADVYRRLLDSGVEDRRVVERLLEVVDPEEDPDLVLELGERLLLGEEGEAASQRARWLADRYAERGDEEARRRVLRLGLERAPRDEALAEALARAAADAGDHEALVALLLSKAERTIESRPQEALEAFREAAAIRLERLGDAEGAAAVVARAREQWPEDPELLGLEVRLLREAGRLQEAAERLGEVLDRLAGDDPRRAELLRQRAEMAVERGAWSEALQDLERAAELDPEGTAGARVRALVTWRSAARDEGDAAAEREATLRLVEALVQAGDVGQAHDVLAGWTREHPEDAEALARRRRLEEEHGLHEGLLETAELLLRAASEEEARKRAALLLADAAVAAGRPEAAREGLEAAVRALPGDEELFGRLLDLYEQAGAHRELGGIMLERAAAAEERGDEERAFEALRRAARSLVAAGEPEAATDALRRAVDMRPEDAGVAVELADALAAWGQLGEAAHVLQGAIERHPRRRSPELGALQHAMARLARTAGDHSLEYQWLVAAFEADKQNLAVASELAELAYELEEFDAAMKALRTVTMGKGEAPMSRARAYLLQARIAFRQGEGRRALLYARKAKSEDPSLPEVDELLQNLGG